MASTRLRETKDGKRFYEIIVSRGRGEKQCTKRWYVPEGWSRRAIDRELTKVSAEFERQVKNGEIVTKKEQKIIDAANAAEEAKIKTVRQYAEQIYMPEKEIECSTNTVIWYRHNLEHFIFPAIGDMKITEVKSTDIKKLILKVQASGLSFRTVKGVYQTTCQLFKMAYMEDVLSANPADKVDAPKRLKSELVREIDAFTEDEERYIKDCLRKEPLKWRTFFFVMMETGCRRGEVCGITWRNIDMQARAILIDCNICYEPHKGVYETTPKNGQARRVYVSAETIQMLKQMREEQLKRGHISPFVFTKQGTSEPINPQSPTAYMEKFGKKYGIEKCNPHKYRHSFVTIALENGAEITSVKEAAGHSDIGTTMGYAHLKDKVRKQTSDIVLQAIQ